MRQGAVTRRALSLALLLVVACTDRKPSGASIATRLAALHAREAVATEQTRQAQVDAENFSRAVARLSGELTEAEAAFRRAGGDFRATEDSYARATTAGVAAITAYTEAERQYRRVASTLVAAAMTEMAGAHLCEGAMSTSEYRQMLRDQGVDLSERDIDHIWPHNQGGANHPLNYQPLPSSMNRSLGDRVAEKFAQQPLDVLRGLAVSALMRLHCANDPRAFGR